MAVDMRVPTRPVSPAVRPYYFSAKHPTRHHESSAIKQLQPMSKVIAEHRGWQLVFFRTDKTYFAVSEQGNWLYLGKYRNHTEAAAMFPEELHTKRGVER